MSSTLNIVLFGETGVGKSSVINLIAGRQIAETCPGILGCTMSSQQYTLPINGRECCVWDTVGLNEPKIDAANYLPAIEQANNLIQQLTDEGGVDLLLFCIRGNRITATVQSNYRLFFEVLCRSQVPIALVVTHLEREKVLEDWWKREAENLAAKYDIKTTCHACVTGLADHRKYAEARESITRLLGEYRGNGRFAMPPEGWLIRVSRLLRPSSSLKKLPKQKIAEILKKRCGLDPKIAEELAKRLKGDTGVKSFNVVLFGETGVGKSSVVNLIAKKKVAEVSGGTDSCTLDSRRYDILIDDIKFAVYDTVGLGEPQFKVTHYMNSIEKAYELITKLTATGGIHLLLFCMRGGRATGTTQDNYRLLFECFCRKDIPIALVLTCLEREENMEDFWTRENINIKKCGLRSDAHACITTIEGDKHTPEQYPKYIESQEKMRKLLKDYALKDDTTQESSRIWFARIGGRLQSFLKGRQHPEKKNLIALLKKRTKLNNEIVEQIADMMDRHAAKAANDDWLVE